MHNKKINVLLVENNSDDVLLIRNALPENESSSFRLVNAKNIPEAIQLLKTTEIDVILLDLFLPGSNGIDTLISIQSSAPSMPIVILTAIDDESLALKAMRLGAQDYLVKGQIDRASLAKSLRFAIERKLTKEALAREKEKYAVTLQSIGDGVITTDINGRVDLMNKLAEELTGWKLGEARGKPVKEIFHIISKDSRLESPNPVDSVLQTGKSVGIFNCFILVAKDGKERIVTDSCAPIKNSNGETIGAVLVFRDVTKTRMMEEELIKSQRLEAIGTLAGGIAHDFNNILTAIMGNATLAMMYLSPEQQPYDLLKKVEKACIRARDLTQQLLTFSMGGVPVKEPSSLLEVIRESANFVLRGTNIICEYDIPDSLYRVDIDREQIHSAINNLILNSIQAMPNGGTIRIGAENLDVEEGNVFLLPPGKYIRITIKDEGIGIPREHLPKIFDPFFTTKQMGKGLGLSTSYAIIKKHGGHISAESQTGKGAVFKIYLPAATAGIEDIEEKDVKDCRGSGKILVMDDEESVRKVAGNILEYLGYEVDFAVNGNEAIRKFRKKREMGKFYDLVILDLTIPGAMGGKEAIKVLKEMEPKIKALVSSGYSNDPIMANFREFGFDGAIRKPYAIREMGTILKKVLNSSQEK